MDHVEYYLEQTVLNEKWYNYHAINIFLNFPIILLSDKIITF